MEARIHPEESAEVSACKQMGGLREKMYVLEPEGCLDPL